MSKKTFKILLLVLLAFATNTFGQSVSGIVSDEFEPIAGATIVLKDTSIFTQTDTGGSYKITANKGDTLIYIFTGFKTQEIVVGDSNEINVTLEINNQLQEIVVTGQGSGVAKKRLSTKVDALYAKEIERLPSSQIDQILQSNTPSAQIRMSSGQSGTASIIRTRGPISANTSTNPVIIVDGIRVDNLNSNAALGVFFGGGQVSTLADIPAASIAKIEYIKGGAATTLYGADAANGVIQIITKKGNSDGEASIFVETRVGVVEGTKDFLRYDRTADALFRTGITEVYNVGMNGGNENFTYNLAGGISADSGFTRTNTDSKKSFSLGVTAKINEKLDYQGSASYVDYRNTLDYGVNTQFSNYTNLEAGIFGDIDNFSAADWGLLEQNIKDISELIDIQRTSDRFTFSNRFKYKVLDNLKANLTIGLDHRNSTDQVIETDELQQSLGLPATIGSAIRRSLRNSSNITADLNATHKHKSDDFTFISMLGGQFFRSNDRQNTIDGMGGIDGIDVIAAFPTLDANDLVLENTNSGIYFLENIGYQNLAFLELGGRFDDNTAAGADANAIFLPKVGASYNFYEHEFYDKYQLKNVLSSGKLRFNYGESTNFALPFSQDNTVDAQGYLDTTALSFGNPGNDNLTSERVKTTEFGFDLNFLNDRIKFSATRYIANTEDALLTPVSAPSSGQFSQIQNIGKIENKGWELALNAKILQQKDQQLSAGFSYNYNQNKVVDMGGVAPFATNGFQTVGTWVEEGQSLGFLRGDISVRNAGGTFDTFTADLGDTFAPHFGSLNINYSFKKFNFFLTGDYQFGGKMADMNALLDQINRYQVFRQSGVNTFNNNEIPDDLATTKNPLDYVNYFVVDNDFIKIRNIGVSYAFDKISKNIKEIRWSFNIRNPFNFTSSGIDTEVTGGGIASQNGFASGGFNFGTLSAPRVYSTALRFQL